MSLLLLFVFVLFLLLFLLDDMHVNDRYGGYNNILM